MSQPFIGITCDVEVPKRTPKAYRLIIDHDYPEVVRRAGGYPVILPIEREVKVIKRYLEGVDGLVIVGGDDVDPRLYGERTKRGTGTVFRPRLEFERKLYRQARKVDMPILGICYGMQLINVLEGGALFQDIRRDAHSTRKHNDKRHPLHRVDIDKASRLGRILGQERAVVFSEHHQAISRLAPGFAPVAFAADGIIEAIECDDENIFAVQWHPEATLRSRSTRRLFRTFVQLAMRRRQGRL
jgi:putative glutamine amidotransferase